MDKRINGCKLIAEIGWNHLGNIDLAKKMILSAKENGADFAKFQTWSVSRLKPGEWDLDGRREIYKKAELSLDDHVSLYQYCDENGINFMSSVFSIPDAKLLNDLYSITSPKIKYVKIPSFESRNIPLIKYCNELFDVVYMSTGTSTLQEIQNSIQHFTKCELHLLHCVSIYPCLYEYANMNKMIMLKNIHSNIGYSDHIQDTESAKVAISIGASCIEKHFTIDNNLNGRDNKFAILPHQLKEISNFIQLKEKMFMYTNISEYHEQEKLCRKEYSGRFNDE
jgi:N,N'-diacetyllegionaminate synthase